MKKFLLSILIQLIISQTSSWGQSTVFFDDFATNQSADWTNDGQIGTSAFYVSRSGLDWGARRNLSPAQLELTNDVSAEANVSGWVFSYVSTESFNSPYNTILNNNPGKVCWYFNIRQIRDNPAGYGSVNYGAAFLLATTSVSANSAGTGYAIVYGQSGTVDPIRLAKFSGGLSTGLTNIVTSNTIGLSDFGNEYISVKVSYNPSNEEWELFLRNDGSSEFADPTEGELISQGIGVDNTYTGIALNYMGAYWQGATAANQTAFFDNFSVTVVSAGTPSMALSASLSLTESNLNGAELVLDLTNETYAASIEAANFELNNKPAGLTVQSVTRNSDTQATLTLAFDGTNFDEDIANFSVSALAAALTGNEPLTSNNLTITAHTKPDATTLGATATINGSATLNGQVSSKGYGTTVTFEYGTDTGYGTTVTASQSPLAADAEDFDVSYNLSGLTNGVEYHYRVVAANNEGTTYGDNQTFTTNTPPSLFISEVSDPWDVANAKYVEVHNYGSEVVDLTANQVFIVRQANGDALASVALEGQLAPGEVFVTTNTSRLFYSSFGFDAHLSSGTISGNGDDGYFLYFNGNHSTGGVMFDAFGVMDVQAPSSSDWWYGDSKATRKSTINAPNPVYDADEWIIVKANVDRMLPGVFPKTVWNGSADNNWTNDANWDNGVPTNTFSVLIWGGAPNFPELTATVDLDNFTLAYNAQLNGQEHLNLSGQVSVMHQIEFSESHENLNRWQYFTSPFSNLTAGGMLSANDRVDLYMLDYDNSINENINNAWAWLNDVSTPVAPGKGYALTTVNDITEEGDDISVSYYHMKTTGTLVDANANTSFNLQFIGEGENNWNMIGNPYLAPINWFDDENLDFSNIQGNTAYIYNPETKDYVSIQSTGSGVGSVSPSGTGFIPAMQGFFVQASSAGNFTISEAARVNNSQAFYKSGQMLPGLRVQVAVDSLFDQTVIMHNEMASADYDCYDADKLISTGNTPQIYSSLESGHKLVFNHLNTFEDPIDIHVLVNKPGEYTLNLAETSMYFNDFDIVLTDKTNNSSIVLSTDNYTFTGTGEGLIHEFTLSFFDKSSAVQNELTKPWVYTNKKQLIVQSASEIDGIITLFDLSGKRVLKQAVYGYYTAFDTQLKPGFYMVQLQNKQSTMHFKVHINN